MTHPAPVTPRAPLTQKRRGPKMCACGHAWSSHVWDGDKYPCEKCPSISCSTFRLTPLARGRDGRDG